MAGRFAWVRIVDLEVIIILSLEIIFLLSAFCMANRKILLTFMGTGILLVLITVHQTVIATHRSDDAPQPNRTSQPIDLNSRLQGITVKILAGKDSIGSGTIWRSNNGSSQVITNSHVLVAQKQPLFIQTADGQVHPTQVVTPVNWDSLDLAKLQFQAKQNYPTAQIDRTANLQVGAAVLAAGFPKNGKSTLTIEKGAITHILNKPLAEGYQVGYSSAVAKGMSGGPLINQQGSLVGINGIHAQPLWDAAETFADGTVVDEPLLSEIGEASWAIPVYHLE
jgi:S1-C subfamily serine protease